MLSENFSYQELIASDTAVRLGIDNSPPLEVTHHLVVLANGLEPIRKVLGHPLIVHSGYRCEALEKVLCAKDFIAWCARNQKDPRTAWPEYFALKAHPKGYAADYICPAFGTPTEIVHVIRASGIRYDQLILESEWVHTSLDPQMRGEVLTATFTDGVPTYTAVG